MRIPVCANGRIIEMADAARAKRLSQAPNAETVRARKTGRITRIHLVDRGDDSTLEIHRGNPRRYSWDHETDTNPRGVWTLRRIPTSTADIFAAAVNECAKAA